MSWRHVGVALAALSLASCASTGGPQQAWAPQIDSKGVDSDKYQADLAECNQYAAANPNANKAEAQKKGAMKYGALGAAGAGLAVVSTGGLALIPLLAGSIASTVGMGAAAGAMGGGHIADMNYKSTVMSCLQGRGYKVISSNAVLF